MIAVVVFYGELSWPRALRVWIVEDEGPQVDTMLVDEEQEVKWWG